MSKVGTGSILDERWKIGPIVGEGACGKVYEVTNINGKGNYDYKLVVKVIPTGKKTSSKKDKEQNRLASTLNYEYMLYVGALNGFPFAPRLPDKFYGCNQDVRYLVMERLEMDLVQYAEEFKPNQIEIAKIGLQLLEGFRWLHDKGFLFIDIKPQNFMLQNSKLYFVDCTLL